MKVILTRDIPDVGRAGTVLNVAAGHARNMLLPRGWAVEATEGNMRQRELSWKRADELATRDRDEAAALAEKLTPIELRFTLKAGEAGQLYGSVSQSDITAALAEKGFEIERRKIALKEPIKKTGGHQVDIRLHGEIVAKIRVVVEAEEQEDKDEEVKDKAEAPSTSQETADEETEQRQAAEASAEISAESPAAES